MRYAVCIHPSRGLLLAALRYWCRDLGFDRAAAYFRRRSRLVPPRRPFGTAPLWLALPADGDALGPSWRLDTSPRLDDVLELLASATEEHTAPLVSGGVVGMLDGQMWM